MQLSLTPFYYIAIDGPIGVGKTTLAHKLSHLLQTELLLETFEDNPFLEECYESPGSVAFQTQVHFLLTRYNQQAQYKHEGKFNARLISDYIFAKNRVFSKLLLTPKEFTLYDKLYSTFVHHIPEPTLIVFLYAEPHVLLERMHQRGRRYEKEVQADYLEELQNRYRGFKTSYRGPGEILEIDTSHLNLVADSQALDYVQDKIISALTSRQQLKA